MNKWIKFDPDNAANDLPGVGEKVLVLFESEFHVEDAVMLRNNTFLFSDSEPAPRPDFWMPIPIAGLEKIG